MFQVLKGRWFWVLLTIVLLGLFIYFPFRKGSKDRAQTTIDSAVFIERIEEVAKLVTVEGHYSEILRYNKQLYDIPGFRKKAMIKVSGRVLVGYDLEKMTISYDDKRKKLEITNLPEAEIIAIDSDAEYLDLEQGMFYKFTREEMTHINQLSKDIIRDKAMKAGLKESADGQLSEMMGALFIPLLDRGWTITVEGRKIEAGTLLINKD